MTTIVARFGPILRRLRDERRWSQEQLAHRANVNRSYLGEVERGEAIPSLEVAGKIADALDVPLSDLVARCERASA